MQVLVLRYNINQTSFLLPPIDTETYLDSHTDNSKKTLVPRDVVTPGPWRLVLQGSMENVPISKVLYFLGHPEEYIDTCYHLSQVTTSTQSSKCYIYFERTGKYRSNKKSIFVTGNPFLFQNHTL